MNKIIAILIIVLFSINAYSKSKDEKTPSLSTDKDKISYSLGVDIARNFKRLGLDFNYDTLVRGLKDGTEGKALLISESEFNRAMEAHYAELQRKASESTKALAEINKKAGDEYRATNKDKPGVITLSNGVQYKIIKSGDGNRPTDNDSVEINYRGAVVNGAEFENSYKRGKPLTVGISKLITGLREALKLMPTGSEWQVVVPPELAYGLAGGGRQIEPNATLIFDVELLGITPGEGPAKDSTASTVQPPNKTQAPSP